MSSQEAEQALASADVVILPVGSCEWHGPHLPLSVDHETSSAFARAAAQRLYPRALVTHTLQGIVRGQMALPGSITIPPHTFIEMLVGTCQSLHYHGVQNILILNGHGSNRPAALAAALRSSNEFSMRVATGSWWDWTPASAEDEIMGGSTIPGHAGDAETSLMLYLRPEMVHVARALGESWQAELDVGRPGVAGWRRARLAESTAAKGQALFEATLEPMVTWIEDFVAGRTDIVAPRSDREGYTLEFLGPRVWYFWAETNQQYMEQFRPRFRDTSGRPFPGINLDAMGNPIRKPDASQG
jgi:creatinine amidohydrolase